MAQADALNGPRALFSGLLAPQSSASPLFEGARALPPLHAAKSHGWGSTGCLAQRQGNCSADATAGAADERHLPMQATPGIP